MIGLKALEPVSELAAWDHARVEERLSVSPCGLGPCRWLMPERDLGETDGLLIGRLDAPDFAHPQLLLGRDDLGELVALQVVFHLAATTLTQRELLVPGRLMLRDPEVIDAPRAP